MGSHPRVHYQPIMRQFVLLRVFLAAFMLCAFGCSRSGLNPGDTAPDFTARSLSGEQVRLSDFRGKVVLLNFWATWCGPCIAELPSLEKLYAKLSDKGFVVVAVGVDDQLENLDNFRRTYGLSFPIVADSEGVTKGLYKTTGVPESFFIARDGSLLMTIDPADGSPAVRISGPREWDETSVVKQIEALLQK